MFFLLYKKFIWKSEIYIYLYDGEMNNFFVLKYEKKNFFLDIRSC